MKLLARQRAIRRHDRRVVVGDAAIHEAKQPDVELGFDDKRQVENRPPVGVPDHDKAGLDAARLADRVRPNIEEFPRLEDLHPQIAIVRDRGPIRRGQIAAVTKLDPEGGGASTPWQINDSHAYALLLDAAMPPPDAEF